MYVRMPIYYSKLAIKHLMPKLRYHQLGEPRPLSKRSGKTMLWPRYATPTAGTALTEGTAPSAQSLSAVTISASLEQFGYVYALTDMVSMTAIDDEVETAVKRLSDHAAIDTETHIRNSIVDGAEIIIDTPSAGTAVGAVSAVGSAHNLDEYVVRKTSYVRLRRLNAEPFGDGYYRGIINPLAGEQLVSDTSWQTWYQYATPETVHKGEIGKIHGVRFLDSTLCYLGSAYSTSAASVSASYNIIFGKQFYGVTDFDSGVHIYVKGPNKFDKSDPIDQFSTVGYKVTFAAKLLNPSAGVMVPTGINFI